MVQNRIQIFICFSYILSSSNSILNAASDNKSSTIQNRGSQMLRSDHTFAKYWPLLSLVGLVGTTLNSYVLYSFYAERSEIISSVNTMIG